MEREPSCQPITKMEFEFERRKVTKEDLRELIFREILEYHPQLLKDYMNGIERTNFLYPRFLFSVALHIKKYLSVFSTPVRILCDCILPSFVSVFRVQCS